MWLILLILIFLIVFILTGLYYNYNPLILLFLLIILLILIIYIYPSLSFHMSLLTQIYPYINGNKKEAYDELKLKAQKFMNHNFKINKINWEKIPKHGTIILTNHHPIGTFIDHLSLMLLDGKNVIVLQKPKKNSFIDNLYNNLECIQVSGDGSNYSYFENECMKYLKNGYNIVIYPEGKNARYKRGSKWRYLMPFQSGPFILSEKYNIPIVPIIISGGNYYKGYVKYHDINIKVLETINTKKDESSENLRERTYDIMMNEIMRI